MPVCSIVRLLPPTASCNNESPRANSFAYTTNRHELTVYHITEYGPRLEKTYEQQWGNNGADHSVHRRSLISVFVIRLLESIISGIATSEIQIF